MSRLKKSRDFYFSFAYSDLFGVKTINEIINIFGSLELAWQTPKEKWPSGLKSGILEKFFEFKANFNPDNAKEYLVQSGIGYKLFLDSSYPELLKNISNPPPIIFYRGNLKIIDRQADFSLAVVGSRITSIYGRRVLRDILINLDERFLIISGLAIGTDANAHRQALAQNLKTGAVVGGPLDQETYSCPASNYQLAQEILKSGGFIISEFPPKSKILKSNFPRRNRIIAGLCKGTLVIEAGEKSGATITAEYARDANRIVMAVPGSIYEELSVGTNNLLKNHIDLVSKTTDIYRCFGLKYPKGTNGLINKQNILIDQGFASAGNNGKLIIMALIKLKEPANTDKISELAMLDTTCIHSTLTILELSGVIRRSGDGQFILAQDL